MAYKPIPYNGALTSIPRGLHKTPGVVERGRWMQEVLETLQTPFSQLHARWQDEKEFEPWSDYNGTMQRLIREVAPNATIVSVNKKPFGITFQLTDWPFAICLAVNNRTVTVTPSNVQAIHPASVARHGQRVQQRAGAGGIGSAGHGYGRVHGRPCQGHQTHGLVDGC